MAVWSLVPKLQLRHGTLEARSAKQSFEEQVRSQAGALGTREKETKTAIWKSPLLEKKDAAKEEHAAP
jgi:hypothetical protein